MIEFEPLRVRRFSGVFEDSIKDLILISELEPGNKLTTEKEISQQVGVSIVTAKEALRVLEAFEKECDPASGLRFNAWVEGGIE